MGTSPEIRPPALSGAGHETRDANIRSLLIVGGVIVATLVFLSVLMVGVFKYFSKTQSLGPPASPFAQERPLPPAPRLQVEPHVDIGQLHAREAEMLQGYAWVDRNAGVVRIPIERAIDLLVEKGLPTRAPSTPAVPIGTVPTQTDTGVKK